MNTILSFSKRAQVGCVAGLVGGFAIFVSIFVIDLSLGAHGTFYKLVGLALGTKNLEATIVGMVVHMGVAALIGTVFGICSGFHKKLEITSIKKGALGGISTGVAVFLVFFMPITNYIMVPLIKQSQLGTPLLENLDSIIVGAAELHIVYGVVMGVYFAIAVQIENTKLLRRLA